MEGKFVILFKKGRYEVWADFVGGEVVVMKGANKTTYHNPRVSSLEDILKCVAKEAEKEECGRYAAVC